MTTLIPKFDLKDGGSTPAGAVNRPINLKLEDTISVKDFGAIGDGVTDDTLAIQAALDSSIGASIYFPSGIYLVSSCLNNTNGYRSLHGQPGAISVMIKSTSTDYIIDNTGTNWGVIQGIQFESATVRVGVYYNRSTTETFSQYNVLRNCRFELSTIPSANGGLGVVAYYNRASELGLVENCQFHSDTPAIITAATNSVFLPIYTTEGGADSMTCYEFNKCVFFSRTTNKPAIRIDAGFVQFFSCYCGSDSGDAVAEKPAILASSIDGCTLDFQIEFYTQALQVSSVCQSCSLKFYMAYASTRGTIILENGNIATSAFIGNNVEIKTNGVGSTSNIGVFSSMNSPYPYITSNVINTCGGTLTPIYYASVPSIGTSNRYNVEISPQLSKINLKTDDCYTVNFTGNTTVFTIAATAQTRLTILNISYAAATSSDYHAYQVTLPAFGGTYANSNVIGVGGSVGTNNDFAFVFSSGTLTISSTNVTGAAVAVVSVQTYYL